MLLFSANAIAGTPKYCQDTSKQVAYVKGQIIVDPAAKIMPDVVATGELVAELNDGTDVLIPCEYYNAENPVTDAIIVDRTRVFTLVKKKLNTKKNLELIGLNYRTSLALVKEIQLGFIKSYYIDRSIGLESLIK